MFQNMVNPVQGEGGGSKTYTGTFTTSASGTSIDVGFTPSQVITGIRSISGRYC